MPRRRPVNPKPKNEPEIIDEPAPIVEETTVSVKASETEKPDKKRTGVFLPLNEDGTIDDKRLRGETWRIDLARQAVANSADAEKKAPGLEVSTDFVNGLYTGFETALQRVGVLFLKWPKDLAGLMRYSAEQRAKLVPPTKAVIEKLAPSWLIKNQEIVTLAVVLAAETQNMVFAALGEYVKMHPELMTEPPKPVNGHAATTSENRDLK
jgi:hypothetical protein